MAPGGQLGKAFRDHPNTDLDTHSARRNSVEDTAEFCLREAGLGMRGKPLALRQGMCVVGGVTHRLGLVGEGVGLRRGYPSENPKR